MIRTVFVTTLTLALAACGRAAPESEDPVLAAESPATAEAGQTAANAAPPAFAQCRTCHQVQPGRHGVGPSLSDVHGRKAGTAPGYIYSGAIKASALTWDDASLDRYI
ncbi:MAG: c-type cytochrome, partial [Tsuneonella sp.]